MIFGNDKLMMLAVIAASDPQYAKQALSNVVEYLFEPDIDLDCNTVMDVIAQTLSLGYAIVVAEPLDEDEIVRRFRKELGEEED